MMGCPVSGPDDLGIGENGVRNVYGVHIQMLYSGDAVYVLCSSCCLKSKVIRSMCRKKKNQSE